MVARTQSVARFHTYARVAVPISIVIAAVWVIVAYVVIVVMHR
jgi:di/tricarboxylate transporter